MEALVRGGLVNLGAPQKVWDTVFAKAQIWALVETLLVFLGLIVVIGGGGDALELVAILLEESYIVPFLVQPNDRCFFYES
jgi:hypothetical protein